MIWALANHLWQSTVFAVGVGLFTAAFRKNRAHVRYRLWLCGSLKFLVPFALLMSLGSRWEPGSARKSAPAAVSAAMIQVTQPFPEFVFQQRAARTREWIPWTILGVWACGFATIAAVRLRDWRRIRAALLASTPMNFSAGLEVRSSPGLLEPGVVGWIRPVLLLPAGIEDHLTAAQLKAVLAHELCHVRRRDNLSSAAHMFVEAIFWFHPLVWWIGARLMEEREYACDEEVLRVTGDPKAYADAILNVCKRYAESPVACVPGVSGANLKKRIEAIMEDHMALKLNLVKKAAIATAIVAAVALPVLVGVMDTPSISAQPAGRARFVSGSIRAAVNCEDGGPPMTGSKKGTRRKSKGDEAGPGTLTVHCATLGGETGLIHQAYIIFGSGHASFPVPTPPLSGGPDWLGSEHFDIEARADGEPGGELMRGPMLQTLLEDKVKLKVHRETRESPAYALVASDGVRRLEAFQEGSYTPNDLSRGLPMSATPGVKLCSFFVGSTPSLGSVPVVEAKGVTLNDFGKLLSLAVDRPVIDATGMTGRFDFHMEFGPDENTPGMLDLRGLLSGARPSLLTAIGQYGLKLVPSRAPREYLVVDHVERPALN